MNGRILFQGNYFSSDVVCKYNPESSRKIDPLIEEKTKQNWKIKLQEAKASGKKIWDQLVYRLDKFQLDKNKCELSFSTIPFSIRTSIKDFTEDLFKKGEDYLPMALYSSIFIETADGNFVFGEKSDVYVSNLKYSYIGGVFNKQETQDEAPDPFLSASSEVVEELGVDSSDIEELKLLGALRSESGNVAIVFYCKLRLNQNEVVEKFKFRNELEMKDLFFAKKEEVKDVCINKIGKEPEFFDIFSHAFNE